MRAAASVILILFLSGCNTTGGQINISTASVSGCIVGGVGTFTGKCDASVP